LKLLMPALHDSGKREIVVHYPHRQYLAPRVRVVVDGLLGQFGAAKDLHLTVADVLTEFPDCVAAPLASRQR
jgi:hypothetical protein